MQNKPRSVILPGSYDPVTLGHQDIIRRAAQAYAEVYAVVFVNPEKVCRFSPEERVRMLLVATEEWDNVLVSYSTGLVIDYMRDHGIQRIIKGYRNDTDLAYERVQAEWNRKMGGYETELWPCDPAYRDISSSRVRAELDAGASVQDLVPERVARLLTQKRP